MTTHTSTGPAELTTLMPRRILRAAVPLLIFAVLSIVAVRVVPAVIETLTTIDSSVTVVPHPSPGPDPATAVLGRG